MLTKDETPFQTNLSGVRFLHYGKFCQIRPTIAGDFDAGRNTCIQSKQPVYVLRQPFWSKCHHSGLHDVLFGTQPDSRSQRADTQARTKGSDHAADGYHSEHNPSSPADLQKQSGAVSRNEKADGKWPIKTTSFGFAKMFLATPSRSL